MPYYAEHFITVKEEDRDCRPKDVEMLRCYQTKKIFLPQLARALTEGAKAR
jgi:hypothetical protein